VHAGNDLREWEERTLKLRAFDVRCWKEHCRERNVCSPTLLYPVALNSENPFHPSHSTHCQPSARCSADSDALAERAWQKKHASSVDMLREQKSGAAAVRAPAPARRPSADFFINIITQNRYYYYY
jgi:hypothetical protein